MNYSAVSTSACAASAIPFPTVFGAEILNLSASLVQNFTQDVSDQLFYNHPSISVKGIDYCNVTVTYTHPGQNDTINVETWLPFNTWNGRLQAVGGGGYVAGRFSLSNIGMSGALGDGYATTSTDGGLGMSYTPDPWALNSPGNVDMYALENLASVSLNDQVRVNECARITCPSITLADLTLIYLRLSLRKTLSTAFTANQQVIHIGAVVPKVAVRVSCLHSAIQMRTMASPRRPQLSIGPSSFPQLHGRR
jgi:hypothetical protein